ncbi:MAG: polyprenyl synthetase family protein [Bacteroidales bacterium]|nr:polyprenyl synthetase family protein [Lachnoclostridium sp.]MCM1385637.1 polyprenyl synthetase family protein [Lachnoclostridium sp.]MCM1465959.1 polyprenyl synthetase family protein [Bacteroidales bacterium]
MEDIMEEQEFQGLLQKKTIEIENIVKRYLPKEEGHQKTVLEAMNYSLMAGGKRLRPMFMQETYRMFGGSGNIVEPFMAALEMIHTYSLVHDDLPAMDNDEYRRGKKTTWKVYGDGMGILAGDGLLNYAFETAVSAFEIADASLESYSRIAKALGVLAKKAGVYGMIGGQTADIEAEKQEEPLTKEQLLFIHENKTAALIQTAMMVGAILAGAKEQDVAAMEKCAYNVGIAFQIQDDILDVTGDSSELGKPTGSDAQNHKQTYVTINGLEKSRQDVAGLSEEAVAILEGFSGNEFLKQLILNLIHRRK